MKELASSPTPANRLLIKKNPLTNPITKGKNPTNQEDSA